MAPQCPWEQGADRCFAEGSNRRTRVQGHTEERTDARKFVEVRGASTAARADQGRGIHPGRSDVLCGAGRTQRAKVRDRGKTLVPEEAPPSLEKQDTKGAPLVDRGSNRARKPKSIRLPFCSLHLVHHRLRLRFTRQSASKQRRHPKELSRPVRLRGLPRALGRRCA